MKKFIPKTRKNSEDAPYIMRMTVEEASYWRKLELICKLGLFPFGSIWAVGEDLWRQVLPIDEFDPDSGREMHPGICTEPPDNRTFPAAVRMFFGSHSKGKGGYLKQWFKVMDLFDEGDKKPCWFGAFPPAAIDPTYYGNDDSEIKTHIRKYKNKFRTLPDDRKEELKRYLRKYYSREVM